MVSHSGHLFRSQEEVIWKTDTYVRVGVRRFFVAGAEETQIRHLQVVRCQTPGPGAEVRHLQEVRCQIQPGASPYRLDRERRAPNPDIESSEAPRLRA